MERQKFDKNRKIGEGIIHLKKDGKDHTFVCHGGEKLLEDDKIYFITIDTGESFGVLRYFSDGDWICDVFDIDEVDEKREWYLETFAEGYADHRALADTFCWFTELF